MSGSLTAASVNATLNASTSFTYADDLCIYVDALPLSTGGLLQVGGFSNLSAQKRFSWPNGGSSAPGTTVSGTVTLTEPCPSPVRLLMRRSGSVTATARLIREPHGTGWGPQDLNTIGAVRKDCPALRSRRHVPRLVVRPTQ